MKRTIVLGILLAGLAAFLGACESSDSDGGGAGTGGPVGGSAGTSGGAGGLVGPTAGLGPAAGTGGGVTPLGGTGGSSGAVAPTGGTGGTTGGTGGTTGGTGGTASSTGPFSFTGKVVNFEGAPIAGAIVKLEKAGASATTGADGTFTLGSGAPDQPAEVFDDALIVTHAEYLDWDSTVYNQPSISDMSIRMASVDHPVYTREMVFEEGTADFPSCHAAAIVDLMDGTLLSTYFGGSKESADDVEVRLSRKNPGEGWILPIQLTDAPNDGLSVENPSIFQEREGRIFVFWKSTHGSPNRIGKMITSDDGGHTWSEQRNICDKCMGPEDGKAVQLPNGDILAPAADRNGFFDGGSLYVEISTDKGETWTPSATNADDSGFKAIQPNILIHADGRLQMMARGRGGKIPVTWSDDNGRTWSALEASTLPANWAGIDVISTRAGRHFIAYNHNPTSPGSKGERRFLTLAVSKDGVAWNAAHVLGIASGGQLSYPAIIQSRDGLLHVVHTWHRDTIAHIVINPYKITDETIVPMPNGEWPSSGPLSKGENTDKEG